MNQTLPHPEEASLFAVLSLFSPDPEHRTEFQALVHDFLLSQARWQPGLQSVEMFTDEGGQQIVTLARWSSREAFEAFKQSESGRNVSEVALTLRPRVFFLHSEAFLAGEARQEEPAGLGMSRR